MSIRTVSLTYHGPDGDEVNRTDAYRACTINGQPVDARRKHATDWGPVGCTNDESVSGREVVRWVIDSVRLTPVERRVLEVSAGLGTYHRGGFRLPVEVARVLNTSLPNILATLKRVARRVERAGITWRSATRELKREEG